VGLARPAALKGVFGEGGVDVGFSVVVLIAVGIPDLETIRKKVPT
jgi:hypothetical protein